MDYLSLIKSSFHDIRCCDETNKPLTAWRAVPSSVSCVHAPGGSLTGYAHVGSLEEYLITTGVATGVVKANSPSDVNYIPDYVSGDCVINTPPPPVSWRALASSVSCVLNGSGLKTGYAHVATLEQFNPDTGVSTGVTKPNSVSDANHIADYISADCTPPALAWRPLEGYYTCVIDELGHQTGYLHVDQLDQYDTATGHSTGTTKVNQPSDPDYIADSLSDLCPAWVEPSDFSVHLKNNIICKGNVDLTPSSGALKRTFFAVGYDQTFLANSGVNTINVVTHDVAGADPVPCTVVINGLSYPSNGNLTASNVTAPYNIIINPA